MSASITPGASAGSWAVIDTNARNGKRTHEAAPGAFYDLYAGEKTFMPRAHALVFLRDSSFKVFNDEGKQQTSLPESEAPDARRKKLDLAPGETVAHYSELLLDALRARAAMRQGGQDLDDAKREEIIAFLMNTPLIAELPPEQRDRISEAHDPNMMSAEEAAKLLPSGGKVSSGDDGGGDPLSMGG